MNGAVVKPGVTLGTSASATSTYHEHVVDYTDGVRSDDGHRSPANIRYPPYRAAGRVEFRTTRDCSGGDLESVTCELAIRLAPHAKIPSREPIAYGLRTNRWDR